MSQKGPSAYFKCLKTKQTCSCLSEMQLWSIDRAVQAGKDLWRSYSPYKSRADGKGFDLLLAFQGAQLYKGGASLLQVTVARLLGKCSLCKNVGYFCLSFSIWSV